jgi:hypothetical protein
MPLPKMQLNLMPHVIKNMKFDGDEMGKIDDHSKLSNTTFLATERFCRRLFEIWHFNINPLNSTLWKLRYSLGWNLLLSGQ